MGHPTLLGCQISSQPGNLFIRRGCIGFVIKFVALYRLQVPVYSLPDIYHQFGSLNIYSPSLETLFLFYPPEVGFGLPQEDYAVL